MEIGFTEYPKVLQALKEADEQTRVETLRWLCRNDLYFLGRYVCGRRDLEHPWLFERCREVQHNPNGYLDLWAREHYKSTIISFFLSIQDILSSHGKNPDPKWKGREITIGIFSLNRPLAKKLVGQIQWELENNRLLYSLFPEILYDNPRATSPRWSLDAGLVVKRESNPREATVEAWGLVDSMPTGSHFVVRVYDDVITEQHARSPEMIKKSIESWELSLNLGSHGGVERYLGTRYNYGDCYRTIMQRKAAIPRLHPATSDGTPYGEPVFLTKEALAKKRREQGEFTFACQMLLDPKADTKDGFARQWLRFYDRCDGSGMNKYLIVDPANAKKKTSDRTAMGVIGLAADGNYYLLDGIYDRLSLTERTEAIFYLHQKWHRRNSRILGVGYEQYGLQADIDHIEEKQQFLNYRFLITPLNYLKGDNSKIDRIKRLIPIFSEGRFYLPKKLIKRDYEGKMVDLIENVLVNEYDGFPYVDVDDFLDMLSRITDPEMAVTWPKAPIKEERYGKKTEKVRGSWMSR